MYTCIDAYVSVSASVSYLYMFICMNRHSYDIGVYTHVMYIHMCMHSFVYTLMHIQTFSP